MSSSRRSPPRQKLSPLPKAPKDLPKLPYETTTAEIDASQKADVAAHFQKKKPEPRPIYTDKQVNYALDFLNTPSQYDLHHKPDYYKRTMEKERVRSKSASQSKSSKSTSGKRADVPQLGQQTKQSIPPLKVLSDNVSSVMQQPIDMEVAAKVAASCGVSIADLLQERVPIAVATPKPQFVMGEPLVSKDRLGEIQTHMRRLHDWYMYASRNQRIMIVLQVPKDYYFRPDEIHVEFAELFQMYNFEALDKSLMSCDCL